MFQRVPSFDGDGIFGLITVWKQKITATFGGLWHFLEKRVELQSEQRRPRRVRPTAQGSQCVPGTVGFVNTQCHEKFVESCLRIPTVGLYKSLVDMFYSRMYPCKGIMSWILLWKKTSTKCPAKKVVHLLAYLTIISTPDKGGRVQEEERWR